MSNQPFPPALETLVEHFARLPGIGKKSAQRLALHMVAQSQRDVEQFSNALLQVKSQILCCPQCQNLTQGETVCQLCKNPHRDGSIICVVADTKDVMALERSHEYKGLYHVLHGVISPMQQIGPDQLRVRELMHRVSQGGVSEVIMATNPDVEGDATAAYLARILHHSYGVKVTRLAYGMSVGSHLEYTDDATLMRALDGRQEVFVGEP